MNLLEIILYGYLGICVVIFITNITIFGYQDLTKGPDPKFGYAYKWGSFAWYICFLTSTPGLNLFVLYAVLNSRIKKNARTI